MVSDHLTKAYVYLPLAFFILIAVALGVLISMQPQNKKIITFKVKHTNFHILFIDVMFNLKVFFFIFIDANGPLTAAFERFHQYCKDFFSH